MDRLARNLDDLRRIVVAEKRELEVLLDRADEMPDDTEDSYQLKEAARAKAGARLSQLDKNLDELEQAVKDT
jgi:hypothetical protein